MNRELSPEPDWLSARLSRGLTLEAASGGICSAGYLSLIETGKRRPSLRISQLLSDRYGLVSDDGPVPVFEPDPFFAFIKDLRADSEIPNPASTVPAHVQTYHSALLALRDLRFAYVASVISKVSDNSNLAAEFRYAANTLLVTALRLAGDFASASECGIRALENLDEFRSKLPKEHFNLTVVVATIHSLTGKHFLAYQLLKNIEGLVENSRNLSAKSLWAASDLAGGQGEYEIAARYAGLAKVEFESSGDERRSALLQANQYWFLLMLSGSQSGVTIEQVVATREVLKTTPVTNHKLPILFVQILWCILQNRPGEARQSLDDLESLEQTDGYPLTAEEVVEVGSLYQLLGDNEAAEERLERFKQMDTSPDREVSGVAPLRLAAELSEKLGRTADALYFWRRMADGAKLVGHEIFRVAETASEDITRSS